MTFNNKIAELEAEINRLKSGNWTVEETNSICHNLHGKVNAREFADGCTAEQRKIYGCAPDADRVNQLQAEKDDVLRKKRAVSALLQQTCKEKSDALAENARLRTALGGARALIEGAFTLSGRDPLTNDYYCRIVDALAQPELERAEPPPRGTWGTVQDECGRRGHQYTYEFGGKFYCRLCGLLEPADKPQPPPTAGVCTCPRDSRRPGGSHWRAGVDICNQCGLPRGTGPVELGEKP